MSERLDHLLDRLGASATGRSLDGLEADVMRSLARAEADRRASSALAPFQVLAVGLALVMGVTAGGLAAASTVERPSQLGALSAGVHLAPSTLLETGR